MQRLHTDRICATGQPLLSRLTGTCHYAQLVRPAGRLCEEHAAPAYNRPVRTLTPCVPCAQAATPSQRALEAHERNLSRLLASLQDGLPSTSGTSMPTTRSPFQDAALPFITAWEGMPASPPANAQQQQQPCARAIQIRYSAQRRGGRAQPTAAKYNSDNSRRSRSLDRPVQRTSSSAQRNSSSAYTEVTATTVTTTSRSPHCGAVSDPEKETLGSGLLESTLRTVLVSSLSADPRPLARLADGCFSQDSGTDFYHHATAHARAPPSLNDGSGNDSLGFGGEARGGAAAVAARPRKVQSYSALTGMYLCSRVCRPPERYVCRRVSRSSGTRW